MADYFTVAEVYRMQYRLIEMFGGLHRVRDKGAVEAAAFRPQTGHYNSIEEEAATLMESFGNNHGFLDGNKRIAFTATDVFLRRKGF
jgi:death on curing protein